MQTKKLTETVSVAGQIDPADLPKLHAQGFRSVVCNRPDGEGDDQPLFGEIERAAANCSVEARYLPVSGQTGPTGEHAEALKDMWDELPKPVLLFCRSGNRSENLYRMASLDDA
ncbi:beta-lactamase hydrolase domain-containing protein [Chachezhania antarctica]|uniref:beta-lactamase hydrolase domain-containing protein n=1 Tax=Chachezhania antarctica TaxID=2340860 RepID=UPI000EAEAD62|nr:sulfur transferase domain-containing protein [Chachezhania antarctica]|tara:strand:- start:1205 stop:1546 length:342 start_codon:yes stop_codon:yes gene_type:complete